MRIANMHSGRGLTGTLLRADLDALAARGCDRFKVSHDLANPAAERAYLGAGFRTQQHVEVYRRTTGQSVGSGATTSASALRRTRPAPIRYLMPLGSGERDPRRRTEH
jgi:hypothetical protein